MEFIKIVWLCIGAAILYGILHDQVTARVCVEYFTVGHPPVFQTVSPTLLALGWGVIATWWVGLILGVPMACVARLGSRPKMAARDLLKPIGVLLGCMAGLALVAGVAGYFAANAGTVWLVGPICSRLPAEKHVAFIADLWSHLAAYGSGFVGGIVLCVWIWRTRGRRSAGAGR
ncbi:MAG: hypothetical protein NTW87_32230 [Planctomycetota bacterium]|nr:hypothetical protein [Planctomycetota bacterium]